MVLLAHSKETAIYTHLDDLILVGQVKELARLRAVPNYYTIPAVVHQIGLP